MIWGLASKASAAPRQDARQVLLCRFCQMMWRLNFLVTLTCIVLQNSYMLYYICPMHTIFTVLVYAILGLGSRFNQTHVGMFCK